MIPGANLLNMAFSVIGQQRVSLERFVSRATAPNGQDETAYAPGVWISGSVQSTDRTLLFDLGLGESRRDYKTLYTCAKVADVERDGNGDVFLYNGRRYQCLVSTDWSQQDGWRAVVGVLVPTAIKPIAAPPGGLYD